MDRTEITFALKGTRMEPTALGLEKDDLMVTVWLGYWAPYPL